MKKFKILVVALLLAGCAKSGDGIAHLKRVAESQGMKWRVTGDYIAQHGWTIYCAEAWKEVGEYKLRHNYQNACGGWSADGAADLLAEELERAPSRVIAGEPDTP